MPFQVGNTYGRRVRHVEHTMRWLIDQAEHRHKVKDACLAVLDKAAGGDLNSFITLRDTIDGKPTQRVEVDEDQARELDLASLMRLVLAARTASADDAHYASSPALTAADPDPAAKSEGGVVEAGAPLPAAP